MKEKKTVWLCRHGNRLDFVNPEWKGDDPPLSEDGVIQAKETAVRLKDEGIDNIYVSPFLRTVETAHHIANALKLKIKVECGISEWLNPEWFPAFPKLNSLFDLKKQFPHVDLSRKSYFKPTFPETLETAKARSVKTVKTIIDDCHGDLLIVGHGLTVASASQALLGEKIYPGLCALVKINIHNGTPVLELQGETSHLSGGKKCENRFN